MSLEESNKMSQKNHSQDSNSDEIQWDLEDMKNAIKKSAEEQWDEVLASTGQDLVPGQIAAAVWEMEKKKSKELDKMMQEGYNTDVESDSSQQGVTE